MDNNISISEFFDLIKDTIEIYIEENKNTPKKIYLNLTKIFDFINSIFENEEKLEKKIKSNYKNIKTKIIKRNFLNEEEENLLISQEFLKQKLKTISDKYRLMEQKYLYFINDLKKEISELKEKLEKEKVKNSEAKDLNKINLFPGLMRKPEKPRKKNIKLIPMFPIKNKEKNIFKLKLNQEENLNDKLDLTTKTDLTLKNISVFDENKLLNNRINTSGNLVYQTKFKEFNDIMMSYPEYLKKHPRRKLYNIHENNNNTAY